MEEMRTCRKCKEEKPIFDFGSYPDKRIRARCKRCCVEATQLWRAGHKSDLAVYRENYYTSCDIQIALIRRFKYFVSSCKRRNDSIELSVEMLQQVFDRQNGRCKYTNLPLTPEANKINTMSIDRIDNTKGYIGDNVQLVCHVVNIMKNKHSEDQFFHLCHLVAHYNKRPDNPIELAIN